MLKWLGNNYKNHATLEFAGRRVAVQGSGPVHCLNGFLLDALQQLIASGDIMNQSNDLSSSPHLKMLLDNEEMKLQ